MATKDYINKKKWDDPFKQEARDRSIVSWYRNLMGMDGLPPDEQYWTLCGNLSDNAGGVNERNEFLQVTRSGLISPKQFIGVEKHPDTHAKNIAIYPELDLRLGLIEEELDRAGGSGVLWPGVVNLDMPNMPEKASRLASKVLKILAGVAKKRIMVVCNVVMNHPYKKGSIDGVDENEFVYQMKNNVRWQDCKNMWDWKEQFVTYKNHKGSVVMSSFVYMKKNSTEQ